MRDADRDRDEAARADRRYNDALTTLDRSLIRSGDPLPSLEPSDLSFAPAPGRSRRWLRRVYEWLAPLFAKQQTFNQRVAETLGAHAVRERERAAALEGLQTSLILFLQQITAFVDTRDRAAAASLAARVDDHDRALQELRDLQGQVAIIQRTIQMLTRAARPEEDSASTGRERPLGRSSTGEAATRDYRYVAFEDRFRGSDDEIREKLRGYVPLFAGHTDVVDLGCGRGEFLTLLKEQGIGARGVDVNREMAATAHERGLDVVESDARGFLASAADGSLGGIMAAQVVEHLEPDYLLDVLRLAFDKLRPGSPIVIETINPACWLAFFSSYIRDFTHVRPMHPETLEYLLQAHGFGRVTLRYSAPVPEHMKMRPVTLPGELAEAAHTLNANAAILNNLMFTHLDYAAVAYRS